jgi:hypothetical protein
MRSPSIFMQIDSAIESAPSKNETNAEFLTFVARRPG